MMLYEDEGRGECPYCFDFVLINRDGSLRKHNRFVSGGVYQHSKWVRCSGSGHAPLDRARQATGPEAGDI